MRKAYLLAIVAAAALGQDAAKTPDQFYPAIRENNLARLNTLLDQKGRANVTDDRGITPLMYAAENGSVEAMRLLIDRGADVNTQNTFGSTALLWSVADPAKVRLLLDRGGVHESISGSREATAGQRRERERDGQAARDARRKRNNVSLAAKNGCCMPNP